MLQKINSPKNRLFYKLLLPMLSTIIALFVVVVLIIFNFFHEYTTVQVNNLKIQFNDQIFKILNNQYELKLKQPNQYKDIFILRIHATSEIEKQLSTRIANLKILESEQVIYEIEDSNKYLRNPKTSSTTSYIVRLLIDYFPLDNRGSIYFKPWKWTVNYALDDFSYYEFVEKVFLLSITVLFVLVILLLIFIFIISRFTTKPINHIIHSIKHNQKLTYQGINEFEFLSNSISQYINDRDEQENKLQVAMLRAENANKIKSQFLANMSHELRTPLSIIIGMTDLALKKEISDKVRHYVMTASIAGNNLLKLVKKMLDYSQLDTLNPESEISQFKIDEFIDRLKKNYEPVALEKGMNFSIVCNDSLVPELIGDRNHVQLALDELVENAFKFSHQGDSIAIIIDSIIGNDDAINLHFQIKDTGIGISEDKKEELFKIFSQIDPSNTREYGGIGLGLAYAKKLIDILDGKLWLDSELGKGSTFHIQVGFKMMID